MALLCAVETLRQGHLGYVHEVVVHADFRRQGIMMGLMTRLHQHARTLGLSAIELTSDSHNEDRQKAIQGYLSLGYEEKRTNVFTYRINYASENPRKPG